jgi:hypothetical protein
VQGTRTGNWLTQRQAEALINRPDPATLKGRRDRALLALMIGCGLRREEVARLRWEDVRQREGRWVIVDLRGKHGRVRSIPMPGWAKAAIDQWAAAAGISTGALFRGVNKGDRVTGDSLTSQGVWRCVTKYSDVAPHDLRRTYANSPTKAAPGSIRSSSPSATPPSPLPSATSASTRISTTPSATTSAWIWRRGITGITLSPARDRRTPSAPPSERRAPCACSLRELRPKRAWFVLPRIIVPFPVWRLSWFSSLIASACWARMDLFGNFVR